MTGAAPQLSPQLSPPQMRPPSRQPPALPRGRPQDQLGNPARPCPHAALLSLGLASFLLHWGWQRLEGRPQGPHTPFRPSLPARCRFPLGGFQPSPPPAPLRAHPKTGSFWVVLSPQCLPGAIARDRDRDRQPFEKIPSLGGLV